MNLLLCAFFGYFVAQAIKTLTLRKLPAWMKMFWAFVGSAGAAVLLYHNHHPYLLVVYGVAGAGLSIGLHRLFRFLQLIGDEKIAEILRGRRR